MRIKLIDIVVLATILLGTLGLMSSSKRQEHAKTHPSPQALYNADNETYFGNMLPHNMVVVRAEPPYQEVTPGMYVVAETVHPFLSNSWTIYVSPTQITNQTDMEEAVLHESCHVYMYQVRESANREYTDEESHGPEWQDCMMTLAKKGAFAQIW